MGQNKLILASVLTLSLLSSCATKYMILRSDMETRAMQVKKQKYDPIVDSVFNIVVPEKEYDAAMTNHYIKLTTKKIKSYSK